MTILNKLFGKRKKGDIDAKSRSSGNREPLLPNEEFNGVPLHKRYKETIVDKIVEIDSKGFVGTFRECHFINCEIKIRCSAKHTFVMTEHCTFENCLIWAHTKQTGGNWNPYFKNCSFRGRFELRFENKVTNSDFSDSKISYLEFLSNQDLDEIIGIEYPNVALINLHKNFSDWNNVPKPMDYDDLTWTSKKNTGLVVMNLSAFTKEPQKMWENIKELDFVKTVKKPL